MHATQLLHCCTDFWFSKAFLVLRSVRIVGFQKKSSKGHRLSNISNPTMRTGLDFKAAQFDHIRGEAEDWIKMRGLEI
jgi:hypothetical protein